MIWTDDTHRFTCMRCQYRGDICPDALDLAIQLARSVTRAAIFTQPGFEVAGMTHLKGCARTCKAGFIASKGAVRVYRDAEMNIQPDDPSSIASKNTANSVARSDVTQLRLGQSSSMVVQAIPHERMQSYPQSGHSTRASRLTM